MNRVHSLAVSVALLFALCGPAFAQTYPERVVRVVNPFPPGGAVDLMARVLAQKLSEGLGQQFIVESRAAPAAISAPRRSRNPRRMATRCCSPRRARWWSTRRSTPKA